MSTNMCTDILLLMLVPKERIASITALGRDAAASLLPGAAEQVAINHGTAEEVAEQQPDLILASPWSTAVLRRLARKVGAPVMEIDSANSFADIRRVTREVGALVGEPERAEELIADMDRKLAQLDAGRPHRPIELVAWNGVYAVPGEGTLTDEIIRAAGASNLAARVGGAGSSSLSIEELLVANPHAILRDRSGADEPLFSDAASGHRLVRAAFRGRQITYPVFLHTCGVPQSADAAVQLRDALTQLPER